MSKPTFVLLACSMLAMGCGANTGPRPEPIEVQGKVQLPRGASPRGLVLTFQPLQNTLPGGTHLEQDGSFKVKLSPGKYTYYFDDEANLRVPSYRNVPAQYRKPSEANHVTIPAQSLELSLSD